MTTDIVTTDTCTVDVSPEIIVDLVGMTWQTFVGIETFETFPRELPEGGVATSISITGPWQGSLSLHCSWGAALASTAAALGMPVEELATEDVLDFVGELANILGGNLKGVVSDDRDGWGLSLPVVSTGRLSIPNSRQLVCLHFDVAGEPMVCEVRDHE